MKTTTFANRHIGIAEKDLPVMLEKIGVSSLDELINKTIPAKIRLKERLPLAPAMTEHEFAAHINALAAMNKQFKSYIGTDGTTLSLLLLSKEMFSRILYGILRILLIRLKYHKADWRLY